MEMIMIFQNSVDRFNDKHSICTYFNHKNGILINFNYIIIILDIKTVILLNFFKRSI